MDSEDPIAASIDHDLSEGLSDPSRVQAILRILPQLLGEKVPVQPVGGQSGLPQTGEQALADSQAVFGNAPSGLPGDTQWHTNLGDIYQKRADLAQRGQIFENEANYRRVNEANQMERARATQGMNVLKWEQEDRKLANEIKSNERLFAQDVRMRIQYIGETSKAAGEPGSPEHRAYMAHFIKSLQDPARIGALQNPRTGIQAMTAIIDEALQASRRPQAATPRAQIAIGASGVGYPGQTGPAGPTVDPASGSGPIQTPTPDYGWPAERGPGGMNVPQGAQRQMDARAAEMMRQEGDLLPHDDPTRPALAADITRMERGASGQYAPAEAPFRERIPGEAEAKYAKERDDYNKGVREETRRAEQLDLQRRQSEREAAAAKQKAGKEDLDLNELKADAESVRSRAISALSQSRDEARELRNAKGLKSILGTVGGATPNLRQDAVNAEALLQKVQGTTVMQILSDLKAQSKTGATGFGALSEGELQLLKASASLLNNRRQDYGQFSKAVDRHIAELDRKIRMIEDDYQKRTWMKR